MEKQKGYPNFIVSIGLACLYLVLGQIIGVIFTIYLIDVIKLQEILNIDTRLLYLFLSLVSCIFVIILVILRVKLIEKRSLNELKLSRKNISYNYMKGFLIGLLLMSAVVLILSIIGKLELEKNPEQAVGTKAIVSVILVSIGWIIQGASEEILTRGWLMSVLQKRYSQKFGIIVSSVFFGILHIGNPNVGVIAIINIILVGFVFSLYVTKTDDLWGACAIHSAWNLAQGNLYGFEVSGIDVQVGTIIDMNLKGNIFVTGGAFGPEAGIITTIVLSLVIVVLLIWLKKDRNLKNINYKEVL